MGLGEKAADFVNPKIKLYTNPLLLALLVTLATYTVCIGIFTTIGTEEQRCKNVAYVFGGGTTLGYLQEQEKNFSCLNGILQLSTTNNRVTQSYCNLGATPAVDGVSVSGTPICDDAQDYSSFPTCNGLGDASWVFNLEVKQCTPVSAAFGAALGYAGVVETVVLLVLANLLLMCGIIKKKENGVTATEAEIENIRKVCREEMMADKTKV